MTNTELAKSLAALAEIYFDPNNAALRPVNLSIYCDTKTEVVAVVRAIGGKFTKSEGESFIDLRSTRLPGVRINVYRDNVCKKTVTWECEPLLSPEEIAEVDEATGALRER